MTIKRAGKTFQRKRLSFPHSIFRTSCHFFPAGLPAGKNYRFRYFFAAGLAASFSAFFSNFSKCLTYFSAPPA